MKKIHLYLLGLKAVECLKKTDKKIHSIISHITVGQDKNIQNDYSSEIIDYCEQNNINYSKRTENKITNSEYLIAIGWRWLIQKNKNQQIIVFHDSILPKYRGFNPLVTALINGENQIGVTAIFGAEEFDKGDIICQWKTLIKYPIKIQTAIDLVCVGYAHLFIQIINEILEKKKIIGLKQNEEEATYSVWRDKQDYIINWNQPAEKIKRFVDAVSYPYLSARSFIKGKEVIIEEVEIVRDLLIENRDVGKILFKKDNLPVVICGSGLLLIKKVTCIEGKEILFHKNLRLRFS